MNPIDSSNSWGNSQVEFPTPHGALQGWTAPQAVTRVPMGALGAAKKKWNELQIAMQTVAGQHRSTVAPWMAPGITDSTASQWLDRCLVAHSVYVYGTRRSSTDYAFALVCFWKDGMGCFSHLNASQSEDELSFL